MKRTSHNYCSREEEKYYQEEYKNFLIEYQGVKYLDTRLLDSSLISTTNNKSYYFKVIDCGDYKQIYFYDDLRLRKDKTLESNIDVNYLFKKENIKRKAEKKYIEYKNINRSKFNLQRLVKANEKEFKTFITLTFKENIIDIEIANKQFRYWRDSMQRAYKNFKYVCVPEFQKRGAVHYHLLTNLDIKENSDLILLQDGKNNQYDVKYWRHGFSSVFDLKNMNVVGYISKYMTKDIDNRLFGKKRYFNSKNLIVPKEYYINYKNDLERGYLYDIINNYDEVYSSEYLDIRKETVLFKEFKKLT